MRLDSLTPIERSARMGKVRSRANASTEQNVAAALRRAKVSGWRRHVSVAGRPDFFFASQRLAVFVHGCFWHGCPRCYRPPKGENRLFWRAKVVENRKRDDRVRRRLRAGGVATMVIWEHELRDPRWLNRLTRRLSSLASWSNNLVSAVR